nr:MAG TPA: hypothetical protein [Caudoviricetes sp.]DAR94125.1 MAG TPA: hypothetical protein [Caudoviricetes sp.]
METLVIRGQIHQIRLGLAQHLELLVLLIQDLQQDVGVLTALCLEACITLVGLRLVQLNYLTYSIVTLTSELPQA